MGSVLLRGPLCRGVVDSYSPYWSPKKHYTPDHVVPLRVVTLEYQAPDGLPTANR